MGQTQLLSHPSLLQHGRPDHPENYLRLKTVLSALQSLPPEVQVDLSVDRIATPQELMKVHTREYVDQVLSLRGKEAFLDHETQLTAGSVDAALHAAGLGMELVERVLQGKAENGFSLVRPPGHHACSNQGMGFCIFNNIALAAMKAFSHGIKRALILDWDVHHGNGTQEIFYEDDRLLLIDLHQENLFPRDSGLIHEHGKGKGLGFTVNVPLPHSCKDVDYFYVMEHLIQPAARKFQPELILVSAGFDAHENDPLGSMSITSNGFGQLAALTKTLAKELSQGKLVFFLEGGYRPLHLAQNVSRCVEALIRNTEFSIQKSRENIHEDVVREDLPQLIQKIYDDHFRLFT